MAPRFLFAATTRLFVDPAHANTGNLLPLLASFFIVIPALLLAPAIAIAVGKQRRVRKAPWIIASLILAVLSFGSLWWATQVFMLMAGPDWPVIYLWVFPGIFLWLAFYRHARTHRPD